MHLGSARCHELSVPRVRCSTFGTRAFSVAGPTVWNSLPDHPAVDCEQFRWESKTCSPDIRNVCALDVLCNHALQIDIYLLTYLQTMSDPYILYSLYVILRVFVFILLHYLWINVVSCHTLVNGFDWLEIHSVVNYADEPGNMSDVCYTPDADNMSHVIL